MTPEEILAAAEQRLRDVTRSETPDWYRVEAKTGNGSGGTKAKVYIYSAIGGWFGVAASDFVRELVAIDSDEIELHLNSPGGSAFDSIAIHNALRQHDASVSVFVDGLAASGASLIAMAGDHITMATGSQMMIHNASGGCLGNADEMRQVADVLDGIDASQASLYARKTGIEASEWRTAMAQESWYGAQEAVDAGLADAISDEATADDPEAKFNLGIFAYAGRSKAPAPRATHKPPAPPADTITTSQTGAGMPFLQSVRERLGVTDADANEETVLAALDQTLAEQTTESTSEALPTGVVAIDQTVLTALQADAASGREARAEQLRQTREGLLTAAQAEGRITTASVETWRAGLEQDDQLGTTRTHDILAGLPKNSAVPMASVGHTGGVDLANDDQAGDISKTQTVLEKWNM